MESNGQTLEAKATVPLDRPRRLPAARRNTFRPQLLLADYSEAVKVLTASLLRRMGCDVDAVEHGEAALGLARHARYHLILLDLDMPFMDGITTAREIRRLSTNSSTPIMAVSAFLEGIGDPWRRWIYLTHAKIESPGHAPDSHNIRRHSHACFLKVVGGTARAPLFRPKQLQH